MSADKLGNAIVVSLFGLSLASASATAERMDCSYSKKFKQSISNQAIEPGDRPDRRMTQYVRVDVLSSKQAFAGEF